MSNVESLVGEWLPLPDVAQMLDVSITRVHGLIDERALAALLRIGWRIKRGMRGRLTAREWAIATLATLAVLSVGAQTPVALGQINPGEPPAQVQAELAAESSRLSNGSPDWRALSLRVARTRGPRQVQELTLTDSSRFGLKDQQISGLMATPLSERLTASLGAQASPSHRVLARHGADGNLQYEFAPAWLLHTAVGFRRSQQMATWIGLTRAQHLGLRQASPPCAQRLCQTS